VGSSTSSTRQAAQANVCDRFHHSGTDGGNPDLETAQETLAFFALGKARLDVLKVFDD
jgi:hypothetical protein